VGADGNQQKDAAGNQLKWDSLSRLGPAIAETHYAQSAGGAG
jgi:hypothetical protein